MDKIQTEIGEEEPVKSVPQKLAGKGLVQLHDIYHLKRLQLTDENNLVQQLQGH